MFQNINIYHLDDARDISSYCYCSSDIERHVTHRSEKRVTSQQL